MKMHARDPKLEAQQFIDPQTGLVGTQWAPPSFDPEVVARGPYAKTKKRRSIWERRFALAKEHPGEWMKCGPYASQGGGIAPREYRRKLLEQGENFDAVMRSTPQERIDREYFVYIRYNGQVTEAELAAEKARRLDEIEQKAREREINFMRSVKYRKSKASRADHVRRVRGDEYAASRSKPPPDDSIFSVNGEDVG